MNFRIGRQEDIEDIEGIVDMEDVFSITLGRIPYAPP